MRVNITPIFFVLWRCFCSSGVAYAVMELFGDGKVLTLRAFGSIERTRL